MNIRKLSFVEWLTVLKSLTPFIGTLVRVAGIGVVGLIRALIDIAGQVEDLFPQETVDGKPVKRSAEKREAFIAMVSAGFSTAEEGIGKFSDALGPIADTLAALLTSFGVFRK